LTIRIPLPFSGAFGRSGVIRGVAAVYNRCRYEPEKRAALDAWAAHVELSAKLAGCLPTRTVALPKAAQGRFYG